MVLGRPEREPAEQEAAALKEFEGSMKRRSNR